MRARALLVQGAGALLWTEGTTGTSQTLSHAML
jgi:hypothetical protein